MRSFVKLSLLISLLAVECAFGQIGYPGRSPGQYPGQNTGQYPSGQGGGLPFPMPGRKTRTNPDTQPTQNFAGMIRKLSTNELTMESDDRRNITFALFSSTRYYKSENDADSGGSSQPPATAKRVDFQTGDMVSVDATQDDNGNYRAAKVALVMRAGSDDRAKASKPADRPADKSIDSAPGTGSRNDSARTTAEDDRPKLRRANTEDSSNRSAEPPADRAADSTLDRSSRRNTDATPVIADARPSLHAEDVNGVARLPDAPTVIEGSSGGRGRSSGDGEEDPIVAQARAEAFSFSETLPNYVVKQFTTRYATSGSRGGRTAWQALDTVTADVVFDDGKESYKNVLINGKPPKDAVEKTGAWSTGEFSSLLQDILSPETDADFHNKRSMRIVNREAYRFDFSVEQRNSHWDIHAAAETYSPAYSGAMWIDKATSRVLRIEIAGEKIPRGFPLDAVESAVDYDFVLIGDTKYLLPVHSEALSCRRGTNDCTRNVIDFRNYKKFGAETNIIFGQ